VSDYVDEMFEAWLQGRKMPEPPSAPESSNKITYDRINWMPESRDARGAVRGRQTTSFWKAWSVATHTLTTRTGDVEQPPTRTHDEWRTRVMEQR
jgi:hypothetical protein